MEMMEKAFLGEYKDSVDNKKVVEMSKKYIELLSRYSYMLSQISNLVQKGRLKDRRYNGKIEDEWDYLNLKSSVEELKKSSWRYAD